MSSEDEDSMDVDVPHALNKTNNHSLPANSQAKYNLTYQIFQKWNKSNGWTAISEELLIKYFTELETKNKPPTLVAIFSMLKATFRINDNIDIGGYSKLLEFLKQKNAGYKPSTTLLFTDDEIEKFLNEASDDLWLDVKVVCIFGISGLWNTKTLLKIMVEHVKRYDDLILVTTPKTVTNPQRTFTITGPFFHIVQKYADLRHENPTSGRFFLCYHDGKCTAQPIGRNKFCGMPKRIAKFLKLPESTRYSALSLRRRSANSHVKIGPWDFGEQSAERVDLDYQTGYLKPSAFSYTQPPAPTQANRATSSNMNHSNGYQNEHVCTLSCGQVKCASEENENSVLHAFTTMKPDEFVISDITPAVYPSDPACRWIVGYTHHVDAVTASNADETFEDITRSIPNNVRINQRYIRGSTIHLPAAYVVVYGVNCKCQKETVDIFNFALNEGKYEV
ncbi:hypothetical protein HA402_005047 [Bradysia odoriphaga]|nr:hypothetical protein HA402_005047 [Bradysia odoriphaga]